MTDQEMFTRVCETYGKPVEGTVIPIMGGDMSYRELGEILAKEATAQIGTVGTYEIACCISTEDAVALIYNSDAAADGYNGPTGYHQIEFSPYCSSSKAKHESAPINPSYPENGIICYILRDSKPDPLSNALIALRDAATRLLERVIQRSGVDEARDNLEAALIKSYDALPPEGLSLIPELAHLGVAANRARRLKEKP